MNELAHHDYKLQLQPELGGAVARFEWRGIPVFRSRIGDHPLESGCFPLVPFSNRIRNGKFVWNDRDVQLSHNLDTSSHPIYGFGWMTAWDVVELGDHYAQMEHCYDGLGERPWAFRTLQSFKLAPAGLIIHISLENMSDECAPARLGFHPYFPQDEQMCCLAFQRGEWQNGPDSISVELKRATQAQDWWNGAPLGTRCVDTAYTEREGAIQIFWPEQMTKLWMEPSCNLPFAAVFTPEGADYFLPNLSFI